MKKTMKIITASLIVLSMFFTIVPLAKTQTNEWSEPLQLTTDTVDDEFPSVMQDLNGKIWLVWSKPDGLWYKNSLDGGISWSDPSILVPDIPHPSATSLLQDSTGRIWVAWAYTDIFYITSDDGGLTWSPSQQLTDYTGDDIPPSLIEVCGEVWIVFRSYGLSADEDIWYRKTNNGGATWSDPIPISLHPQSEFSPYGYVDSTGKIWIVWIRGVDHTVNEDIYYKTSTDCGLSWSEDQPLTITPSFEGPPAIIEDSNGKIFVFYTSYITKDTYNILYKTTEDSGNTWSDAEELTGMHKNENAYAALINCEIWVVWQRDEIGNWDIWMSKLTLPAVTATVNIDPDTLNLKSNGQWITAYITLPEGYNVEDIVAETVKIDDIPLGWSEIQDDVFMVKFDRAAVQGLTNEPDYEEGTKFSELTLTIRGKLINGTPFEGTDTIRVIMK